MADLGVKVGIHKSLLSPSGTALEFAKRFIYKGFDASAIPLKEVYAGTISVSATAELFRKYKTSLSSILAFNGYGFRSLSKLQNLFIKMPSRMRAIVLTTRFPNEWSKDSFLTFLGLVSINKVVVPTTAQLQSVNDQFIDLLQKQISKLDVSLLKYLTTIDRTRAHYGTTSFEQDPRILSILRLKVDKILDFSKLVVDNELYQYIIMINEFIYRNIFFDTIIKVRDITNELDSLKANPTIEGIEALIPKLLLIEEDFAHLPFVQKEQARIISKIRIAISRHLKMWKSANLGIKMKR